jgi:hypothetical protein
MDQFLPENISDSDFCNRLEELNDFVNKSINKKCIYKTAKKKEEKFILYPTQFQIDTDKVSVGSNVSYIEEHYHEHPFCKRKTCVQKDELVNTVVYDIETKYTNEKGFYFLYILSGEDHTKKTLLACNENS